MKQLLGMFREFWDTGYLPVLLGDIGIFGILIKEYGIFRNLGIWDTLKIILGY